MASPGFAIFRERGSRILPDRSTRGNQHAGLLPVSDLSVATLPSKADPLLS